MSVTRSIIWMISPLMLHDALPAGFVLCRYFIRALSVVIDDWRAYAALSRGSVYFRWVISKPATASVALLWDVWLMKKPSAHHSSGGWDNGRYKRGTKLTSCSLVTKSPAADR